LNRLVFSDFDCYFFACSWGFKINVNNDKCVVNCIIAGHHVDLVIKLCTVVP
jgi:hypothetical protein